LGSVSELPYAELGTALEQLTELTGPPPPRSHPHNPLGRLIGAVGSGVGYADYMARAADLERRRRAACLAATLRGEGVGNEDAATAVGAASLRNPYDDEPLEWDAAAGTVVFTGLEQGERRRHAVLLEPRAPGPGLPRRAASLNGHCARWGTHSGRHRPMSNSA